MPESSPARVLVTGATGNVGRVTIRALQDRGIAVRGAVSDPSTLRHRLGEAPGDQRGSGDEGPPTSERLEAVRLDFYDPSTFGPALDGCDAMFLLRPPAISKVKSTLNLLVDEAARRGVRHVVFLSVEGADTNRVVPHHKVEVHLLAGTVPWTILRPGFFAQNLTDAYRLDIRDDDRIYVPAGDAEVAFVDAADIGEAAATAFADPATHRAKGYTLTGPATVTFPEVASMLSETLGRSIRYEPASLVGYLRHLHRRQLPLAQIAVQTVLHVGLRRGASASVDPALPELLGRPAGTMAAFIERERSTWLP